jgi:hypothetical protein
MHTYGNIISIFLGIVAWVACIWYALKAKPLGNTPNQLPYRLGTMGLSHGISFLGCLNQMILRAMEHDPTGVLLFVGLSAFNGVNCVLLLRRKRLAVSVFISTYTVIIVSPFVAGLLARVPMTTHDMQNILPFVFLYVFFFLLCGGYLWKRRGLLAA